MVCDGLEKSSKGSFTHSAQNYVNQNLQSPPSSEDARGRRDPILLKMQKMCKNNECINSK